jgi:hypothetical protein
MGYRICNLPYDALGTRLRIVGMDVPNVDALGEG